MKINNYMVNDMRVYLNELRTNIKIITDGSELFIIPNPPENPALIKENEEILKGYQTGEFKDMNVDEFIKGYQNSKKI